MVASQQFVITSDDAGQRLDLYLVARLPELSRTRIQQLIDQQQIRVNRRPAHKSARIRCGDTIELDLPPRPRLEVAPEDLPVEVLYADEDMIVVNKPAGMTVHLGAGTARGTLVNALVHRFGTLSSAGGALRPGIVHRLDRGTSGVLLVARNDAAHRRLAQQFQARRVEKTYLALVHGHLKPDTGTIRLPVARDRYRRTRMTTQRRAGREARTDWQVLERLGGFTLVEVKLHTGRTHQIRVHFAAFAHPVVGDTLYGAPRQPRAGRQLLPPLGRNFLHAARIAFEHPGRAQELEFRAPLPEELRRYLVQLAQALGLALAPIDAALRRYL